MQSNIRPKPRILQRHLTLFRHFSISLGLYLGHPESNVEHLHAHKHLLRGRPSRARSRRPPPANASSSKIYNLQDSLLREKQSSSLKAVPQRTDTFLQYTPDDLKAALTVGSVSECIKMFDSMEEGHLVVLKPSEIRKLLRLLVEHHHPNPAAALTRITNIMELKVNHLLQRNQGEMAAEKLAIAKRGFIHVLTDLLHAHASIMHQSLHKLNPEATADHVQLVMIWVKELGQKPDTAFLQMSIQLVGKCLKSLANVSTHMSSETHTSSDTRISSDTRTSLDTRISSDTNCTSAVLTSDAAKIRVMVGDLLSLLKEMKPPTPVALKASISALHRVKHFDTIRNLFNEYISPKPSRNNSRQGFRQDIPLMVYNQVLHSAIQLNDWILAERIVNHLLSPSSNIQPDRITASTLLNGSLRQNNLSRTVAYLSLPWIQQTNPIDDIVQIIKRCVMEQKYPLARESLAAFRKCSVGAVGMDAEISRKSQWTKLVADLIILAPDSESNTSRDAAISELFRDRPSSSNTNTPASSSTTSSTTNAQESWRQFLQFVVSEASKENIVLDNAKEIERLLEPPKETSEQDGPFNDTSVGPYSMTIETLNSLIANIRTTNQWPRYELWKSALFYTTSLQNFHLLKQLLHISRPYQFDTWTMERIFRIAYDDGCIDKVVQVFKEVGIRFKGNVSRDINIAETYLLALEKANMLGNKHIREYLRIWVKSVCGEYAPTAHIVNSPALLREVQHRITSLADDYEGLATKFYLGFRLRNVPLLIQVHDTLSQQGITNHVKLLEQLLDICSTRNEVHDLFRLWELVIINGQKVVDWDSISSKKNMVKSSRHRNVAVYGIYWRIYCKRFKEEESRAYETRFEGRPESEDDMPVKSSDSGHSIINKTSNHKRPYTASRLKELQSLFDYISSHYGPTDQDYSWYLKCLAALRSPQSALQVAQSMISQGFLLTEEDQCSLLDAFSNAADVPQMTKYVKSLVSLSPSTMNTFLKGLLNAGKYADVNEWVGYFVGRGLIPDDKTRVLIIRSLAALGKAKEAEQRIECDFEAKVTEEHLLRDMYNSIMLCYAKRGDVKNMERVLRTINAKHLGHDRYTFAALMEGYGRAKELPKMLRLWNSLVSNNAVEVNPTPVHMALLLDACGFSRSHQIGITEWQKMVSDSVLAKLVNSNVLNSYLEMLLKCGLYDVVVREFAHYCGISGVGSLVEEVMEGKETANVSRSDDSNTKTNLETDETPSDVDSVLKDQKITALMNNSDNDVTSKRTQRPKILITPTPKTMLTVLTPLLSSGHTSHADVVVDMVRRHWPWLVKTVKEVYKDCNVEFEKNAIVEEDQKISEIANA